MTKNFKVTNSELAAFCASSIEAAATTLGERRLSIIEGACVAVRKAAAAVHASKAHGACLPMAKALVALLNSEGMEARLMVGIAGWRTGPADGDCVTHGAGGTPVIAGGLDGHAWVAVRFDGNLVFVDPTTAYLKAKMDELDAATGDTSNVDWCPPQLVFTAFGLTPLAAAQAMEPGTFAYLPMVADPDMAKITSADTMLRTVAMFSYSNPDVVIITTPELEGAMS